MNSQGSLFGISTTIIYFNLHLEEIPYGNLNHIRRDKDGLEKFVEDHRWIDLSEEEQTKRRGINLNLIQSVEEILHSAFTPLFKNVDFVA